VSDLVRELLRIGALVVLSIVLGFAFDAWGTAVAIAMGLWIAWHTRQFLQFARWTRHPLARPENDAFPWERPVTRLYRSLGAGRARTHRLLERLRDLTDVTRALPDGAVVIRRNGEIETFNEAAAALFGLTARDRGNNLVSLVRHPALSALVLARAPEALIEMALPKQPERRLEVRRIDFDTHLSLLLARDVTQLNRLLSMRQDFVANVSHELRTPLTVVLGYLESLEDESMEAAEIRVVLDRMRQPARRMKALVDDLLLLTRLESSPTPAATDLSIVRVEALLKSIIDDATALSGGRHEFLLDAEPDLAIWGLEPELHSAFSNLVTNAVRYSPDGGLIRISWHRTPAGASFDVEDPGLGIAPEHLSRITERFYRVDLAGARVRGGTGLGLAITKHVLKRHGSTLRVASELGRGSRFGCTFPAGAIVSTDGAPSSQFTKELQ